MTQIYFFSPNLNFVLYFQLYIEYFHMDILPIILKPI